MTLTELTQLRDRYLNVSITNEAFGQLNSEGIYLMNSDLTNNEDFDKLRVFIEIANILYNNVSLNLLPIDDDMYDYLVAKYMNNGGTNIVGAPPLNYIPINPGGDSIKPEEVETLITPFIVIPKDTKEESFFVNENGMLREPQINQRALMKTPYYFEKQVEKKNLTIAHEYPKLVGTLNKVKIVLNEQARQRGVYDDPNIKIFERDFLGKHLSMGLFDMNTPITLILELKYDGLSVEATVSDHIISARSRGDTENDVAADLTPILGGYPFKQIIGKVDPNDTFGMKFEAIINKYDLAELGRSKDRYYKNGRNAIIGLFGSLDGYLYRDLITLVPLATSLEDISRLEEIEFMNKYYHSGEQLRYTVVTGNYVDVLYQVNKFVQEAEAMRPYIPFMYDGVVVSYADEDIRQALGRTNSINNYSIAIKFNPLKKQTVFLGYDYTVGHTGSITPMIHYRPVEFFGTIHDKASGHSLARFRELNLAKGDLVDVEYSNDVMAYVTKSPDNPFNTNPPEQFPSICPICGTPIVVSASGKSASCPNLGCDGRRIAKMTLMIDRLGIKDFSEESVRALGITSFIDLMKLTLERASILGENNAVNLISQIDSIKTTPMYDNVFMSALCFSGISQTTWNTILKTVDMRALVLYTDDELRSVMSNIKGIGDGIINTILTERKIYVDDINWAISNMNIVHEDIIENPNKKVIRFSGIRDKDDNFTTKLRSLGHDVAESSVTKTTNILIVPSYDFVSDKVEKAKSIEGCIIVSYRDFVSAIDRYLL